MGLRHGPSPLACAGYPAFDECYVFNGTHWPELARLANERYWARGVQLQDTVGEGNKKNLAKIIQSTERGPNC